MKYSKRKCGQLNKWPCDLHPNSKPSGKQQLCTECVCLYQRAYRVMRPCVPSFRARFANTKLSAKLRGLQHTLTYDQFLDLISRPCIYAIDDKEMQHIRVGIDRLDSSKGYLPDNCAPSCHVHNTLKSNILTPTQTAETAKRYGIRCANDPRIKDAREIIPASRLKLSDGFYDSSNPAPRQANAVAACAQLLPRVS